MLKEVLTGIVGKQRQFLILRIAGLEKVMALELCKATETAYNHWTVTKRFHAVYVQRDDLETQYRDEALSMLRRDNQLAAIFLEKEIVDQLRVEIRDKDYHLVKTHLGREVYSKLVAELDKSPSSIHYTWEQLIMGKSPEQLGQGDGENIIEATGSEETEHQEGEPSEESQSKTV